MHRHRAVPLDHHTHTAMRPRRPVRPTQQQQHIGRARKHTHIHTHQTSRKQTCIRAFPLRCVCVCVCVCVCAVDVFVLTLSNQVTCTMCAMRARTARTVRFVCMYAQWKRTIIYAARCVSCGTMNGGGWRIHISTPVCCT